MQKNIGKLKEISSELYKKLTQNNIIIEEDGIRIVINAAQEFKEFTVEGISNNLVIEKLNKAIQLTQEAASKELATFGENL